MVTFNSIIKELNGLPVDKLEDVYEYIHSIKEQEKKVKDKNKKKIMSFAGAFSGMSDNDFTDLKAEIKRARSEMFTRKNDI